MTAEDRAAGAPTVSVVICAFSDERWNDLRAAVESVRRQEPPPSEIVLVIDHNEELRARAESAFADAIVVSNTGRQGLSDARNAGVGVASSDVIAFLDDDAVAAPGWLRALVNGYASRADVIGVGGAALPAWDVGRPAWFPEEFDWVVGCSYRGLPVTLAPIRNFLGCNMSFRREAFELVGGFHTDVGRVGDRPVGGEETELCIRLSQRARTAVLLYQPEAVVHHRVPTARAGWRYFRRRCYAEGVSKAVVSRLVGSQQGLASERRHAFVTLPRAALGYLGEGVRHGSVAGLGRAAAVVAGLGITSLGYAAGRLRGRTDATPRQAVEPGS